jgi:phenylpropionate dioxygenase-like ring-hydroxylating dioxygenase large terminal subunit
MDDTKFRASMVDNDQGVIDREIFSSGAIYQEELEKVFTRAWLFIGHESQIPNRGDFIASRMGAESVILCRDFRKQIHVFLNTCTHRGMKVCLYDEGNTTTFTCPFHAWSFGPDGKLIGVPHEKDLYSHVLDKEKWSLIEVPKMQNYKGSIWASWDATAPNFFDYLGGAKAHLDLALDSMDGSDGGTEVFDGIHKWISPCNWKVPAENFCGDSYHNVSHLSVDMIGIGPSAAKGEKGRRDNELADAQHLWISFPGGHGIHSAMKPANNAYVESYKDNPIVEEYYRHCYQERQLKLGDGARIVPFVGTIFPNTSFHGRQPRALCSWHPNGAESTEIWRFFLVDKMAPKEVKDFVRRYYMRYAGPAGMTEQDDMENWNYATAGSRGVIAKRHPFNYQQSQNIHKINDPVPGMVSTQMTEENARQYYKCWASYMENKNWPDIMTHPAQIKKAS